MTEADVSVAWMPTGCHHGGMTVITGSITTLGGKPNLIIRRRFAAPVDEMWAELTESAQLERWIGRWEGDPASGSVMFTMTAEAEDAPPEEYFIRECDKPRRFAGETSGMGWHLWFELDEESDGGTTLTFGQRLRPDDDVSSIGPGWEYYLDRLVAAQAGLDAGSVKWDDYYPELSGPYLALLP